MSEWVVTVTVPGSTRDEALMVAEAAIRAIRRDAPTEIVVHVQFVDTRNPPPAGVISTP